MDMGQKTLEVIDATEQVFELDNDNNEMEIAFDIWLVVVVVVVVVLHMHIHVYICLDVHYAWIYGCMCLPAEMVLLFRGLAGAHLGAHLDHGTKKSEKPK